MPEKETVQRLQQQAEAEEAVVEEVALDVALAGMHLRQRRRRRLGSWLRVPKIPRPVVLVSVADQREEEGRRRWTPLQLLSPRTMEPPLVAAEAEGAAAAVVGPSSLLVWPVLILLCGLAGRTSTST